MVKHEVIFALINTGFSQVAMEAAKESGARGGTIMHARGTGDKSLEKKYNIVITPDKEVLMILVESRIRDKVLASIYKAVGLGTPGQGIAFSLPVEDVVGLKFSSEDESEEETENKK